MKIFMRFPGGKAKAVTLSYDDGVRQDKKMIEILNKYGLKCTFNINSGLFEKDDSRASTGDGRMCEKEVRETYIGSGHEIAVHGYMHEHINHMPNDPSIVHEMFKDRENLEGIMGGIVSGAAYAYGAYNDRMIDIMKECGLKYSRTTNSTERFEVSRDWMRWNPTCHHNCKNLQNLVSEFVNLDSDTLTTPKLFYLWGHTYEFEHLSDWSKTDLWYIIEDFAKAISGRDDIWYAVNGDIYNYVEAYYSLNYSSNGDIIHNPSAVTVYFYSTADKAVHSIKPGETLKI